ncbi:MAG: AfsR/SARP family transcriptional regulator [Acidimicrobiales bacterium]
MTCDQVDWLRFERLRAAAAMAPDPSLARARLTAALGLWRGEPMLGMDDELFLQPLVSRLREARRSATIGLVDARLALGESHELVGELVELARRHPEDAGMAARHMTALHRAGRPGDALRAGRACMQVTAESGLLPPRVAILRVGYLLNLIIALVR